MSSKARQLAARHLHLWTEPSLRQAELKKMRGSNAEWDIGSGAVIPVVEVSAGSSGMAFIAAASFHD